jgi:hypothetical protein
MSKPNVAKPIIDNYLFNMVQSALPLYGSIPMRFAPRSNYIPELMIENLSGYFGVPGGLHHSEEFYNLFRLQMRENLQRTFPQGLKVTSLTAA